MNEKLGKANLDLTDAYGREETLTRVRRLFSGAAFFGGLLIIVASIIAAARGMHGYSDVFGFLLVILGSCLLMLSGLGMTK